MIEILLKGNYKKDKVTSRIVKIDSIGEAEAIDRNWQRLLENSRSKNLELFNGKLLGLSGFTQSKEVLHLDFHKTDFKTFAYTNSPGTKRTKVQRADALGNSVVLVTSDNRLVLGLRSGKVFRDKGKYHCVGGHLELSSIDEAGYVDTFQSISDEILEELVIDSEQIAELTCLGFLRDVSTRQPEQIFSCKIAVDSGSLKLKGEEHHSLATIENSQESIADFLAVNKEKIVPVAIGALKLHNEMLLDK